MKGKYLTEKILGQILAVLYPDKTWIHNQTFKLPSDQNQKFRFRPDYCCHELKMCVEFDGPDHFMKADVILADRNKNQKLIEVGYTIIRIPYFIQLNTKTIKYFLNIDASFNYKYKHGFVSKNVILPSSFCEQGIWRFKDILFDLERGGCKNVVNEIKQSLKEKVFSMGLSQEIAELQVLPSALLLKMGFKQHNYDSPRNFNIVNSNLKEGINCVLLESSTVIQEQSGIFDMEYLYNSNKEISGYSFKMHDGFKVYSYCLIAYTTDEESVILELSLNNKLVRKGEFESESINIFNITDFIFD